jgi:hypothetical protein
MNATVQFHLHNRWLETEPDAQTCHICGDKIFFPIAWLFALFFGETRIAINEEYFLCDSCHEILTRE